MNPIFVATCGLPCSGKSEAAIYLQRELGFMRVSTDKIRDMLLGRKYSEHVQMPDYEEKEFGIVWGLAVASAYSLLQHGYDVVFDSTAAYGLLRKRIFQESPSSRRYLIRLYVDDEEITKRRKDKGHDLSIDFKDCWEEPTEKEAREFGYEILRYPNNTPGDLEKMKAGLLLRFRGIPEIHA